MMLVVEGPAGAGVTADPSKPGGGARDYELERGVDIYGYWYRSPGENGGENPGRPDDAEEYIGMKPPPEGESSGGGSLTPEPTKEGVKRRRQGL